MKKDRTEYKRAWQQANKDKANAASQRWREANREKSRQCSRAWRDKFPEKVVAQSKQYLVNNRAKVNEKNRVYTYNRRRSDPSFRIMANMRSAIIKILDRNSKAGPTLKMLGCPVAASYPSLT